MLLYCGPKEELKSSSTGWNSSCNTNHSTAKQKWYTEKTYLTRASE